MVKKIFLAIAIVFLAIFPLLHKGLPPTHDGEYHVIRFFEFNKVLLDGSFYPRWAPDLNNGFGIPLFNYVYPLPNYMASFFHLLGFSFIDAFKLNLLAASLIGAVFFYLWARQFWGDLGGLVSSAFYSFSPYHLLDIYIRGSVGEVWALGFFPAFLWSVTKFIRENNFFYGILSSIFLSLLIFSHNILAFMFFPFGVLYTAFIYINQKGKKSIFRILLIFILGISLSSIFWIPAIFEKGYVRGLEVYNYSSNFPEFYQLIIPSWGSGFSGGSLQNELSFQVGLANLFAIFLSIILLFKKNLKEYRKIIYFFLASFFFIFFLMLSISKFVWQIVPFMNFFQFPWRLLSLEILVCSFLAGSIVMFGKQKALPIILILITILLGIGYAKPAYYHLREDNHYTSRSNFIDGTNSPGNAFNTIWAGNLQKQENKVVLLKGKISKVNIKSTEYTFTTNSSEKTTALVNTAYFPGWTVYIDGKDEQIQIGKNGNFSFEVPLGNHDVSVKFEDTPVRKWATVLSLVSLLFIVLNLLLLAKNRHQCYLTG